MTTVSQKGIVGYAVFILAVLILVAQLSGLSPNPESVDQATETTQVAPGTTGVE
ncbi:MAG: hypothetical protein ACR2QU_05460 [Gammaproteobacteria bacterium]